MDASKEKILKYSQKFSELVLDKVINCEWVDGIELFLESYYKN